MVKFPVYLNRNVFVMISCIYIYIYISLTSEINVQAKLIKMIFSLVKEYDVFTGEKITSQCYFHYSFRITSIVFVVSLTNADSHLGFFNSSNFFVFEQSYQVLVCIFKN